MSVSIRDVAKACGVSTYTVSSVINNKGRVAPATRERVMQVIRELDYHPTRKHSPESNGTVSRIGLILPFGDAPAATFYMRALSTAKSICTERGLDLSIFTEDEVTKKVDAKLSFDCQAFLYFAPNKNWEHSAKQLGRHGRPVAVVRRVSKTNGVYSICDDDYAGSKKITEFLLQRGYKNIALIGRVEKSGGGEERLRGYQDALQEQGIRFDDKLVLRMAGQRKNSPLPSIREHAGPAIQDLRKRGHAIDAVICLNDALVAHLLASLHSVDLQCPNDIAIAGYGDEEIASMLVPSISSVHMPIEEMMHQALECILHGHEKPIKSYVFENEIIERESTPQRNLQ